MTPGLVGDPTIPADVARHARQLGPLESPWIWITLAVLAALLSLSAIRFRSRRRVRRPSAVAALCCAVIAIITGINSYVGYVRTAHDLGRLLERGGGPAQALGRLLTDAKVRPQDRPAPAREQSQNSSADPNATLIERIDISDPADAVPSGSTFVLLPPGYTDPANVQRRYPVVYLVHGYPYGGPEDWLTAGDAPTTLRLLYQHQALDPMIVVSVDLNAGQPSRDWEGLDVPGGPRLDTYLARTVVATIDQRYRTIADRAHRGIGGMSGGGFAALNIGLHHLDQFSALLIALPYDTPGDEANLLRGDQRLIDANTPRNYLPIMPFPHPVAVILAVGTGAPTDVATAERIATAFHSRGQNAVVHTEHGFNHTWHTARASLPYLLVFAGQVFRHGAGN